MRTFNIHRVDNGQYLGTVQAANMMDACLFARTLYNVKYSEVVASPVWHRILVFADVCWALGGSDSLT